MRQFSELEIQAADILLKFGGDKLMSITHWLKLPNYSEFPEPIIRSMAHQLESDGLILLKNDGDDIMYKVKPNAKPYQFPPENGYNLFLQEEADKKAEEDAKLKAEAGSNNNSGDEGKLVYEGVEVTTKNVVEFATANNIDVTKCKYLQEKLAIVTIWIEENKK